MSHPTYRIAVGADHGAFELKNAVVAHLKAIGHEVHDFGTHDHGSVDYSDYANLVARNVGDGTYDFGILACTSGVGMSIAANRHRHVRSADHPPAQRFERPLPERQIHRRGNRQGHGRCLPGHPLRGRPA